MTFGKLRLADWFRYDRFGINVYIKADKQDLLNNLYFVHIISEEESNNLDSFSMDEIIEKYNKAVSESKLGHCEFEKIAGEWYVNLTLGDYDSKLLWSGDYDSKNVECIDIKNFKLPSIFLK